MPDIGPIEYLQQKWQTAVHKVKDLEIFKGKLSEKRETKKEGLSKPIGVASSQKQVETKKIATKTGFNIFSPKSWSFDIFSKKGKAKAQKEVAWVDPTGKGNSTSISSLTTKSQNYDQLTKTNDEINSILKDISTDRKTHITEEDKTVVRSAVLGYLGYETSGATYSPKLQEAKDLIEKNGDASTCNRTLREVVVDIFEALSKQPSKEPEPIYPEERKALGKITSENIDVCFRSLGAINQEKNKLIKIAILRHLNYPAGGSFIEDERKVIAQFLEVLKQNFENTEKQDLETIKKMVDFLVSRQVQRSEAATSSVQEVSTPVGSFKERVDEISKQLAQAKGPTAEPARYKTMAYAIMDHENKSKSFSPLSPIDDAVYEGHKQILLNNEKMTNKTLTREEMVKLLIDEQNKKEGKERIIKKEFAFKTKDRLDEIVSPDEKGIMADYVREKFKDNRDLYFTDRNEFRKIFEEEARGRADKLTDTNPNWFRAEASKASKPSDVSEDTLSKGDISDSVGVKELLMKSADNAFNALDFQMRALDKMQEGVAKGLQRDAKEIIIEIPEEENRKKLITNLAILTARSLAAQDFLFSHETFNKGELTARIDELIDISDKDSTPANPTNLSRQIAREKALAIIGDERLIEAELKKIYADQKKALEEKFPKETNPTEKDVLDFLSETKEVKFQ